MIFVMDVCVVVVTVFVFWVVKVMIVLLSLERFEVFNDSQACH